MRTHYKCCTCSSYFPIQSDSYRILIQVKPLAASNRFIYVCCKGCEAMGQIPQRIRSTRPLEKQINEPHEYAITSELAYVVNRGNLLAALNNGHGLPFEVHFAYGQGAAVGVPGLGIIPRLPVEHSSGGES